MKPLVPLLVVSVAANAALLTMLLLRQPAAENSSATSSDRDPQAAASAADQRLRAALVSGDAAALAAAGCPPDIIRTLGVGRAYRRQYDRMRALRTPPDNGRLYWRREPGQDGFGSMTREQRQEFMKLQRDFQDEMIAAGQPQWLGFGGNPYVASYLPADVQEKLSRIEWDYREMNSDLWAESGNLQLESDKDKQKLLQTERERDIAALLGPEVYAQYQLRGSPSATTVRNRYGSAINSEAEYGAIFAVQKSFDDQYGGPNPPAGTDPEARRVAEGKLQEDIATMLGPERVQAVLRDTDPEFRTLTDLSKRLNLPSTTPEAIYAMRDNYAAESAQITATPGLSAADQSAQLKVLAARAQADLDKTLGAEAATAFAGRAMWLKALKNGSAFSTAPASATPLNPTITVIPPHK